MVSYLRGGVPIVLGTVAAVIRERRETAAATRGSTTAGVASTCHARTLQKTHGNGCPPRGLPLADTSAGVAPESTSIRWRCAKRRFTGCRKIGSARSRRWRSSGVRARRAAAHRRWHQRLRAGGNARRRAVGVIKSHRTMYAERRGARDDLRAWRARSGRACFCVTSPKRTAVRELVLADARAVGRDPMWGLVRVEVVAPDAITDVAELARRANDVSRWILAEAAPVALPDRAVGQDGVRDSRL